MDYARFVDIDRSTFWPYKDGEPGEFLYQRYGHPTGVEAERRLGELDGGHALLFSSGTGAATALVLTLLSSGDTVGLAEGGYFGTGVLFRELERWGLRVVEFDQTGAPPGGIDLVWLEAPSNPFLTMPDLEAAAAQAAPVVVDSTAATPVHLRPLEHGVDYVLHSATKYLGGHSDVMLGVVVCTREEDAERLKEFRTHSGIVPCSSAASRRSSCASGGKLRPRRSSHAGSRHIPQSRSCAIPTSGDCSPSTSPAPKRPATSRRPSA